MFGVIMILGKNRTNKGGIGNAKAGGKITT